MEKIIKQIISFILPVTVLIFIPLYIESDISVKSILTFVSGLILMCAGLFIMVMTISEFIRTGKGTLAPWSPTKKLITRGLYAYVRNPMITGVLIVLLGETIAIMSLNLLVWTVTFFIINNLFFVLYEESDLKKRFGDEYLNYKKHVPRWIPRLKPYDSDSGLSKKQNR